MKSIVLVAAILAVAFAEWRGDNDDRRGGDRHENHQQQRGFDRPNENENDNDDRRGQQQHRGNGNNQWPNNNGGDRDGDNQREHGNAGNRGQQLRNGGNRSYQINTKYKE